MKSYLYIIAVIVFSACGGGKKIYKTTEDRTLIKTIKDLDKNPDNSELRSALAELYKQAAQSHLDKIDVYNKSEGLEKWDKVITEYQALRSLSETVNSSPTAQKILNVPSYVKELETARQDAASAYYDSGLAEISRDDRESCRAAWYDFRKADQLVPGFKNAKQQMAATFQKGTINIIVNPVRDNSYFYSNMGRNSYGNSFNNDMFQRDLVRDFMGYSTNRILPAKFYTDWDIISTQIKPDWEIDLIWASLDVPRPFSKQYTREASKQIVIGTDTSGNKVYKTVTASLYITKRYFTATGDMDLRITEATSGQILVSQRFTNSYTWQEETATYSGDSRALEKKDWDLINNRNGHIPSSAEVLEEIQRRIYPQVKNRIYEAVRW
jgi:hypothetical protein